ncbi:hypothetical protein FHX41_3588 [Actinomadura hallensis]|uniref:Uncharacterized protein n=1 Tax=Actinomadura hallensis TaxID=337895 RepID=A0A543IH34_9ACTN|nr:hypothetical protein [Actinomadura hallensis]TQM69872.1 hypothetical protein FHX41_3588 [Actinomadura hallensis]
MGVDDSGGSDTRTETTDNPTPQKQPSSPPPDNPGSPGQPSRLESLARAREQQEARAQDKDAGSSPREERDGKATAEQNGSGSEEAETSGTGEAEDRLREDDEKPGQQDKREQRPSPREEGTADARDPGGHAPVDRDRPQARTAEQGTEPADKPAPSDKRWTPPPDNPGSPGQPSRLESLARARELQQERSAQWTESTDTASPPTERRDARPSTPQSESDGVKAEPAAIPEGTGNEQTDKPTDDIRQSATETTDQPTSPQEPRPGTSTGESDSLERTTDPPPIAEQGSQNPEAPASGTDQPRSGSAEQAAPLADGADQPHPTDIRTKAGDDPTGQNPEATEPAPDTGTRTGQPGEPSTDNTQPSPEEPSRDQETSQHGGDRDGESAEPESSKPETYISPDFTSYNAGDGKKYYTVPLEEISKNSDNTDLSSELEKANKERSPYAMTLEEFNRSDLSPTDADVEPGVAAKSPDRREQADTDSESRIERARRATWMRGGDLKDAGKALSDTVNGILGPRPPTPAGRTESGTGPYITPSNVKGATPDAFVATATAAMLVIEGARKAKQVGSQLADRIRGEKDDSNG